MTALGQRTLVQHLLDRDSLETLAREGLDEECLPDEELRKVYNFALDYFHQSGRSRAPSYAVLREHYGDLLDDREIDVNEDPDDSVEWAIDDLKGTYVYKQTNTLNKALAGAMAEADVMDRVEVIADYATQFVALSMRMETHESKVDAREAMADRLTAYEARAADRDSVYGLSFGIRGMGMGVRLSLDSYIRGIHPGELAVLAAGPKVGKSFFMCKTALSEWQAGRTTVLYTLENSVEMTLDRVACMANAIDARKWMHGEAEDHEVERIRTWIEEVQSSETPLHIIQPSPGQRTVETMVRQAQLLDADSLLLDQLTFIEPEDERAPRHLQIREITHNLKSMISTGRGRMPCLLAHQINREGVKAADKSGMLEMHHLAEGCFDDQTEVMTENGWKLFRDVGPRERVATLSPSLDIVYQHPRAEISYQYDGDLWTYDSSGINFAVTPNHRFLVKDAWKRDGGFRFEQVSDLINERYAIPRQVNPVGEMGQDVWIDLESTLGLDALPRAPFTTGLGSKWTIEEDQYIYPGRIKKIPYSGMVYCFNVPNSTLLVRRNGVPMWSGNSEVERTADWVFGLYRSQAERALERAKFQTLASRREETRNFQLQWAINRGFISIISEIDHEGNVILPDRETTPIPAPVSE